MRVLALVALAATACGRLNFGGSDGAEGGGATGYAAAVLADKPQLFWRFEEAPGAPAAVDSSGHGRNGLYFGSPTLGVPGLLASDSNLALALDGTSATYVALADPANLSWLGISPCTIEAWIELYASDGAFHEIASKGPTAPYAAMSLFVQYDPGTIKFSRNTASGSWEGPWSAPVAYSTRMHVVATYDGSMMVLYVNARLSQTAASLSVVDSGAAFSAGFNLDATIDELAVYDFPLTAERVLAHFAAGS